jgi:DNA repair protein RadC
LTLKDWNKDDLPREKLSLKGPAALSDTELIAILLRSGTRNQTVVDLARRVLALVDNNLAELGRIELKQLQSIKGIGLAKGITLLTALELGRRRTRTCTDDRPVIHKSADVWDIMGALLSDLVHEEFWVLALNQAGRLVGKKKIGRGGLSETMADVRVVFKFALENAATRVILVHNHPSGEKYPSKADTALTSNMKNAGNLLNIQVADHIIIAGENYFSFKDDGLL